MAKIFTPGTIRWLSAAGHPGYSRDSARKVLAYCERQRWDTSDLRLVSAAAFSSLYR